jgi:hypothetical protein
MLLRRSVLIILVVFLFFFSGLSNASAGTATYTYDDANRLVGVSNSAGAMQYSYDIVGTGDESAATRESNRQYLSTFDCEPATPPRCSRPYRAGGGGRDVKLTFRRPSQI